MADKKNKNITNNKKTLVLLDAHAIIHRAYHAMPEFSSSKGEPTGGLYGLSAMLIKIIKDLKPDYIVSCYDLPEPTFRKEIYKDYKAGRAKIDESLIYQINRSRDIFESLHIPIYEKAGFEADDILGTIVEKLKNNKDLRIIIASGDMDTMQLVSGNKVVVYTLKKGINDTILYDEDAVIKRFGFGPKLLPDYKGLRGDPSDNIIGIVGIGEKTATILIQNFGTIEDIYKKLKKDQGQFEKAGIKPRIINLLIEGEEEALFSKTLAQIRLDVPIDFSLPNKSWVETFNTEKAEKLFKELEFRSLIDRLKMVDGGKPDETKNEEVKPVKEEDAQDIKKTAIALWLIDSSITNPSFEDILEFTDTNDYHKTKEIIFEELKNKKLEKVYKDIELPLIPVLEKMKKKGILVDVNYLKKLSKDYHKILSALEKKIYKYADGEFNINSPKQLGVVLFDKLDLTVKGLKKTGTGARSTRASELEKLKGVHPIIDEIMEYREYQKLLSTYIDNIPDMVESDGRLHADFIQTGTTTGRMSSANPNLQNIPIRNEIGRNIRKAFVADKGYKLLAFDYSQIELRIGAFLSGDKTLIDIFSKGEDIHAGVGSLMFGVSIDKVDKEMRRQAKVINFGIFYGMGVNALRTNLKSSREEASKFLNDYFEKFAGLAKYIEQVKSETRKKGYTETYFGRRRYFPGIKSSIPFIRAMAERMAVNAPIQGTQSDIIKIAMAHIDDWIIKEGLDDGVHLLLQIHDELIYEVKDSLVEKISSKVKEIMEGILAVEVPFVVNVSKGDVWGELK